MTNLRVIIPIELNGYVKLFKNPIIEEIFRANPNRNNTHMNLVRRSLKLCEEAGEAGQAMLAVTSEANLKGKTWEDVVEELADTFIVSTDIVLTDFADQNLTPEQLEQRLVDMIRQKLQRWEEKMQTQERTVGFREDTT